MNRSYSGWSHAFACFLGCCITAGLIPARSARQPSLGLLFSLTRVRGHGQISLYISCHTDHRKVVLPGRLLPLGSRRCSAPERNGLVFAWLAFCPSLMEPPRPRAQSFPESGRVPTEANFTKTSLGRDYKLRWTLRARFLQRSARAYSTTWLDLSLIAACSGSSQLGISSDSCQRRSRRRSLAGSGEWEISGDWHGTSVLSEPAPRHTGQAHVKPSVCSFSWAKANNANNLGTVRV